MKKTVLLLSLAVLTAACGGVSEKGRVTDLLKRKLGTELPFREVRIARVEGGTAAIVDKHWCYWIDDSDRIYCVNGNAKTVYRKRNGSCADAPIEAEFADIDEIAE